MKNFPIQILIIVLFFTFCKKKDTTPAPASITPVSNTGLTPSTGGDMCGLQTSYRYLDFGGVITKDSMVFASFYAAPVTSVAPTNIYAGTVTINNADVPFQSSSNFYYITTNLPINITGPLTWGVSGSGTVTAFSQTLIPSYPKYTGGNLLPDTCIKANGITINISGVTNNQNSVSVYLYSCSGSVSKYILGSTGSVSFTSAELASFPLNQSLTISLDFTNSYSATHNGVKHGFANGLNYQKISYLK